MSDPYAPGPFDESLANWSTNDLTYTASYSKISCLESFYYAHVIACYFIALSGIACMVTRIHPILHPYHAWSGRIYVLSMLWSTATSLLIHNTGLPLGVLLSFAFVLVGMTVAWVLIIFHRDMLQNQAMTNVSVKLAAGHVDTKTKSLETLVREEKGHIASRKTCAQRLFSLKAAHGALMFVSWLNIFGRIFASDQSGDFTCHTQPYFKAEYTTSGMPEPVPVADPNFERLPWARTGLLGWGFALSAGPLLAGYIFGGIWAAIVSCRSNSKQDRDSAQYTADSGEAMKEEAC